MYVYMCAYVRTYVCIFAYRPVVVAELYHNFPTLNFFLTPKTRPIFIHSS